MFWLRHTYLLNLVMIRLDLQWNFLELSSVKQFSKVLSIDLFESAVFSIWAGSPVIHSWPVKYSSGEQRRRLSF